MDRFVAAFTADMTAGRNPLLYILEIGMKRKKKHFNIIFKKIKIHIFCFIERILSLKKKNKTTTQQVNETPIYSIEFLGI